MIAMRGLSSLTSRGSACLQKRNGLWRHHSCRQNGECPLRLSKAEPDWHPGADMIRVRMRSRS
jgi:hypothetical protein